MSQHVPLDFEDIAHEGFFDPIQEMLSGATPSLDLVFASATTLRAQGPGGAAGAGDAQASLSLDGFYRFRTTNADAAHPGGAAGTYDVWATGTANDFTGPPEDIDQTDYSFGLTIAPQGSPPAATLTRKVGEVEWDGSQITYLRQLGGRGTDTAPVDVRAGHAGHTPLRARAAASQTADVLRVERSDGQALVSVGGTGGLTSRRSAASDAALQASVVGDAVQRFVARADGQIEWGDGAAARDTNLYRSQANVLKTDDALAVGLDLEVRPGAATRVYLGAVGPGGEAGVSLGSSGYAVIYRSGADALRTPDSLTVDGSLTVAGAVGGAALTGTTLGLSAGGHGALALSSTSTPTGLTIGGDVNLYRVAADTLRTDDYVQSLRSAANGGAFGAGVTGEAGLRLVVFADGEMEWGDGGAGGRDVNLYRSAADQLRTDDLLHAPQTAIGLEAGTLPDATALLTIEAGTTTTALWVTNDEAAANPRLQMLGDGTMRWGAGATNAWDTNLYRAAASVLKTDDELQVVGSLFGALGTAHQVGITSAGMVFGTAQDTNLYRSAANKLKTDDTFSAAALQVADVALASTHLSDQAALARLAGPAFTGVPTAPTATVDTNSTQLATTAFVLAQAASATPLMDGAAAVGTSTRYARADHVHASDTSRQPLDPTLTALAAFATNGLMTRTAADTFTGRTIAGTANQVTVTNGDGVAGNPTLSLPQSIHSGASPSFAGLTLSGNLSVAGTIGKSFRSYFSFTRDEDSSWPATNKRVGSFRVRLEAGQTAVLSTVEHMLQTGSGTTFALRKNGSDVPGYTAIAPSTSQANTDAADVALADGDRIDLICTAQGTGKGGYVEVTVKHSL